MRTWLLPILSIIVFILLPTPAGAQRWTSVDVGFSHACGLDEEGRAFCWGENDAGQLGAATPERCFRDHHGPGQRCAAGPSEAPLAVAGGHRFRAIRAGYVVTCGVDVEGRLLCWGLRYGPEPVPAPYASALRFRDAQETDRVVCGALAEGGGRCWKRWGDGWREDAFLAGVPLSAVDAAAHPGEMVCAVAADGRALCRGENDYGQLGIGVEEEREGFVEPAGGRRWAELRTAPTWTCGRTTEGEVFCWGSRGRNSGDSDDDVDSCGYGYACALAPRRVAAGVRLRMIDRGREEMCGLTEDGKMLCWDQDGGRAAPAAEGFRFRTIAGGYHGWCGITTDGALHCWGWQQGPTTPARVPPP